MAGDLRRPDTRECERCGRRESWDENDQTWRIAAREDERLVGNPYCIHEWDINGKFVPFEG